MRTLLIDERGSFLVGGALFIIVFLMVAGFAVDLALYYNRSAKLQEIADAAAMSGGQALRQFKSEPDTDKAYEAVWDYIKQRLGEETLDVYGRSPPDAELKTLKDDVTDHVEVRKIPAGDKLSISGDTEYRVGVVVYSDFEPYFLPRSVFGDERYGIHAQATARVVGKDISQQGSARMNCMVMGTTGIDMPANNVQADTATFCSNREIDLDDSSSGAIGDVFIKDGETFSPPGGSHGSVIRYSDWKNAPKFKYENDTTAFDTWIRPAKFDGGVDDWPSGSCSSGNEVPGLTWSDTGTGNAVCMSYNSGQNEFSFPNQPGNPGGEVIEAGTNDPVSLYVDGNLEFNRNDLGIQGGYYVDGDVSIRMNHHDFLGDPDVLGGLALWSDGNVTIDKNQLKFEGIVGADGDLDLSASGGGNGPYVYGVFFSGGQATIDSNTNNAGFIFDREAFSYDVILMDDWFLATMESRDKPTFANATVTLVD
ncbi:MAG: pilus assembly protein TadG-related protein [bacterium]